MCEEENYKGYMKQQCNVNKGRKWLISLHLYSPYFILVLVMMMLILLKCVAMASEQK